MAKTSGLGMAFAIGGIDISGDINAIDSINGGSSPLDMTDITMRAMARQAGSLSGGMKVKAFMNNVAGAAHPTLAPRPTTDLGAMAWVGTTVGSPVAACVGKQLNYDPKRASSGSLLIDVEVLSNAFSLEWCTGLTAFKRTDVAATNGAGNDNGASNAFGLTMYVQIFALSGTSVTIKLQDSNDDGGTDPYTDTVGATTGAVVPGSVPTTFRIVTAGGLTVKRWLRVVTVGTFNPATFAVAVNRNPVAPIL